MKYQLVSCDLDDTVFGPDLAITPRTQVVVNRLKEAGVHLCVNTGRFYSTAYPHAQRLGIEGPMGLCQGAAVVVAPQKEMIATSPVPREIAVELLQYAEKHDLLAQFYNINDYFHDHENHWTDFYEKLARRKGVTLTGGRLSELLDFDPLKVLYVAEEDVIARTMAIMKERYGDRLEITISRPNYLEFNRPGTTKGRALKIMADYYGVDMSRTVAIGDALNDVSMIKAAALGIAMGNANEDVKAAADVVTLPCDEEGFAYAMEEYVLK